MKALMINGAHEITGSGSGSPAPNTSQGWGQVRLINSLYFEGDSRRLLLVDEKTGLQTGAVATQPVVANAGQPLIITLTWHDFPALVNAMPHSVNQLRLEVEAPNGDVWTQKLPATGGLTSPNPSQSTTTSNYDDTNNVHQIRFATPQSGTYQVRVRGIQVAQGGTQPYALVATGDITNVGDPDFFLQSTPLSVGICSGDAASFNLGVLSVQDFNDPVTLALNGLPAPATSGFSVNPVVPASPATNSVMSINGSAGLTAGSYPLQLQGSSSGPGFPAVSKNLSLTLNVTAVAPQSGTLTAPADGAINQPLRPAFSWAAFPGASQYRLQIATDAGFSNLVLNEVVSGTSHTPAVNLASNSVHHWRVAGVNDCGEGVFSAAHSFTTSNLICRSPALSIPDNNPSGITDTMTVTDSGTLASLRLSLNVTHTYIGDLRLTLSKGGTTVQVVNRPRDGAGNCSGDDMVLTLDDGAATAVQPACVSGTGQAYTVGASYRPANPLTAFAGASLAGDWSLQVVDSANLDTGSLVEWCLRPEMEVTGGDLFADGFE